jgi:hypothetical protein
MRPPSLLFIGLSHYALADTDWSLNAKFSDGAMARGAFVTNSAGTALLSGYQRDRRTCRSDYVSASSNGVSTSNNFGPVTTVRNPISWPTGTVESLEFADFGDKRLFRLYLGEILTRDPITIVGALDCGPIPAVEHSLVTSSGSIVDPRLSAAKEMVSIILSGSGVVFVSLAMRRRQTPVFAVPG